MILRWMRKNEDRLKHHLRIVEKILRKAVQMKDMMKNLFHKPKVLFMLMVICLSPLAVFQIIRACPPDPCPDLLEAWRDAADAAEPYLEALEDAIKIYDDAYMAYLISEVERLGALKIFGAAGVALAAAIGAKAPWLIIIGLTYALKVADDNYKSKRLIRDVKFAELIKAEKDMDDAYDAYKPYHNALIAAMNAYYAAGC